MKNHQSYLLLCRNYCSASILRSICFFPLPLKLLRCWLSPASSTWQVVHFTSTSIVKLFQEKDVQICRFSDSRRLVIIGKHCFFRSNFFRFCTKTGIIMEQPILFLIRPSSGRRSKTPGISVRYSICWCYLSHLWCQSRWHCPARASLSWNFYSCKSFRSVESVVRTFVLSRKLQSNDQNGAKCNNGLLTHFR